MDIYDVVVPRFDHRIFSQARPTAFAQPHAIPGDTARDGGELAADAVHAGDDEAPPTLAAMSVPVATAVASINATSSATSDVGSAGLGDDAVGSTSTAVSAAGDITGSIIGGRNNSEAGGTSTAAAVQSENRNININSTEHALDAKSAIERHLRNLIPDQQQTQRQRTPTKHNMNGPLTRIYPETAGNRADEGNASVPRGPEGEGALPFSPDDVVSSTNPFSSGFSTAGSSTAAAGGGDNASEGVSSMDMQQSSSTVRETASAEGSTETVGPGIFSSEGDSMYGRGGDALSKEGTREAERESARAELKLLLASEKGRGHFLQVLFTYNILGVVRICGTSGGPWRALS